MHPESIQQFARLLVSRMETGAEVAGPSDADLCSLVEANRLGPLFYLWGIRPELWRDLYVRNVSRAEPAIALGLDVAGRLEQAEIPCLPLRGPFWGMQYWGDPAARTFSDLDLLVPSDHAERALTLLEKSGFNLRPRGMPTRFFRSVHLHYPLVHSATGIFCDLHWAVDHPFSGGRIPYESIFAESTFKTFGKHQWRVAAFPHEWLLAALHFAKELPPSGNESDSTLWARALISGQFKQVLDLSVCGLPLQCGSAYEVANRLAREWHVEGALNRARTVLQGFHDLQIPLALGDLDLAAPQDSFMGPLGFRAKRLGDVMTYLRKGSGWRAGAHLICAGCIAAACVAVWKIRNLRLSGAA
jgi:hypothetical protein